MVTLQINGKAHTADVPLTCRSCGYARRHRPDRTKFGWASRSVARAPFISTAKLFDRAYYRSAR